MHNINLIVLITFIINLGCILLGENMESNKQFVERHYYGLATFENFWGKNIKKISLGHTAMLFGVGMINEYILEDIPNKGIVKDCFGFKYYLGVGSDMWHIEFWTEDGEYYKSSYNFYCNLTASDNGKVIMGINGESKRLYLDFPSSANCSTQINRINE